MFLVSPKGHKWTFCISHVQTQVDFVWQLQVFGHLHGVQLAIGGELLEPQQ